MEGNRQVNDEAWNKSIVKLATQYASCDARSAEINDERSNIRSNAEKLGIPSAAFQEAVAKVKKMSPGELSDHITAVDRVMQAFKAEENLQQTLWPTQAAAAEKRAKRKEEAKAEKNKGKAGAPDPDKNPRSDPAKGGAKPRVGKKGETGNVVQFQPPSGEQQQAEGQEGDAVLNGLTPETQAAQNAALNPDGKPKSQSQIAAEKMEAAKLN